MQKIELKVKGLYLSPNDYSSVPDGALLQAENCVLDKESVLDSRRGQTFYSSAALAHAPAALFNFNTSLLAYYGTTLAHDDGTGIFTAYAGAISPPDADFRIHSVEANKNFYFTTSEGIKKLDSVTGTIGSAGAPPGLDLSGSLTGTSGFLDPDRAVAYRVLWGIKDANGNLIIGAPSQRFTISKAATPVGSQNVSLSFTVPDGITTAWFYQIYRSDTFSPSTVEPNDELYLAYEGNPTSGDITAKLVTVTDATPDTLLGNTLYTSPTQQGIENSNNPPPYAKDVALFNNMTLYANTKNKNRLLVTYLGGLTNGATITISGMVFTGQATEVIASRQFAIATGGTPAENIEDTSLSLVRVINRYASNTAVYAYYLSGFNDLPGQLAFEERAVGGASFAVTSSAGSSFNPTIPVSGTTLSSSNDAKPNGIYISKTNQPEAVPLYAYVLVGSANKAIRRIIALRDSVFVFKDDGIFRLTGSEYSTVVISLFDGSKRLSAYNSPAIFDNQIFCFVDQGVVAVSEQGVQILSKPVENNLLMVSQYSNFNTMTFGVGYDSDRKYMLWTVRSSGDTYATVAWIWNSITSTWTSWDLPRTCGIVLQGVNKLYMGNPENSFIYVERKTLTFLDYADESYPVTIASSVGKVVTLTGSSVAVEGDALRQGDFIALIESVDGTDLTVNFELPWAAGAATIDKPFLATAEFVPCETENPALVKQFSEVSYLFKEALWRSVDVAWSTNNAAEESFNLPVPGLSGGGFGTDPFGATPFGGLTLVAGRQVLRTLIPQNCSRANWINSKIELLEPFTNLSLMGMEYTYNPMTTKLVAA